MGVGFGGHAVFNRASPSSHAGCVARIVQDYLPTGRAPRILDVGGTAGFVQVTDRPDLPPNAMGVKPPPMPRYFVIAGSI